MGISKSAGLLACLVALVAASPVLLPEEEEVLAAEAGAEARTEDPDEILQPIIVVPKVAINLHEIPDRFTETTLIAVNILADLGALDNDSAVDDEIGEDGSTSKPPPQVILEALPLIDVVNATERISVRSIEDSSPEGDDKEQEEKSEEYDARSNHSNDDSDEVEYDKRK